MGFSWHCIIRQRSFKNHLSYIAQPYNSKMSISCVDRALDRVAKRKSIDYVIAFDEQDDYLNNHLHFAWRCPIELSREQLRKV